jgi:hypothetical protein
MSKLKAQPWSSLSLVVANIFMEHFETLALNSFHLKPKCWFRFVDDTFVIWPHGHPALNSFFNHLNRISPHIQFMMETQKDNSIPFLDVLISHLPDGSLTHQVFRKKTHTDRYLHAKSHHHPTQKSTVLKTLITRSICNSTPSIPREGKIPPNQGPDVQWLFYLSNQQSLPFSLQS